MQFLKALNRQHRSPVGVYDHSSTATATQKLTDFLSGLCLRITRKLCSSDDYRDIVSGSLLKYFDLPQQSAARRGLLA